MYVDEERTPYKARRGQRVYYFCSAGCLRAFEAPYQELRTLRWLAALSAGLAIPILALTYLNPSLPLLPREIWLFILALPVQAVAGLPFYRGALDAVRARAANMDTLIALGTSAAFLYSALATFAPSVSGAQGLYYDVSAAIIALILIGRLAERSAKRRASEAIARLMELQPSVARVVREGREVEVPVEEVNAGELVVVRAGERIPVDGVVVEGYAAVDQAAMTGESVLAEKKPGDRVLAATVNLSGLLKVRAERVGQDTAFAEVIRTVQAAQLSSVRVQRLADRISAYFVPAVMAIAAGSALGWRLAGMSPSFALLVGVAVLIIACPCALGIATPAALVVGLGRAAQAGIIIREPEQLERLHNITTLILDKTGTLTRGRPRVTAVHEASDEGSRAAAAMASASSHPLSKAIALWAQGLGLQEDPAEGVEEVPGRGLRGRWRGKEVLLGNLRFMKEQGIALGPLEAVAEGLQERGMTPVCVAVEGRPALLLGLEDELREGAEEAVRELRRRGLELLLVTGDEERVARAVAKRLGIEGYVAGVLPADKAALIRRLQAQGKRVAMAGDGINDAPALAQADVGIAMGDASDIAKEAGGIVLVRSDPRDIVRAIDLGRKIMGKIRQNLFWAFAYNVALIPVAAGALYPLFGLLLSPILAAAAMALSSITVVTNSLSLQRLKV